MTAPTHSLSPSPSTSPKGVDQLARVAGKPSFEQHSVSGASPLEIAEHTKNGANGAKPNFETSVIPRNEAATAAFSLVDQGFLNARGGSLGSPRAYTFGPIKKIQWGQWGQNCPRNRPYGH